jgi:O-antigen ligase
VPVAILAELGLIGFGALVFLVGTVLRDLLRWWRDGPWGDPSVVALTAIAAGIAAAGLVWDLHLQRVTWIVLGLLQLSLERRDVPASTAVA